jgi:hypothetical protein
VLSTSLLFTRLDDRTLSAMTNLYPPVRKLETITFEAEQLARVRREVRELRRRPPRSRCAAASGASRRTPLTRPCSELKPARPTGREQGQTR